MKTFKAEEDCIHGRDMVEDFHLSHEAIKIAKRTGWGANTEMQVFAVGIQRGMDEVNRQIAGKDIQISGMETEIQILKAENARYREALVRVMNSDLVTTSQFRDYSEAFDNAREALKGGE